MRNRTRGYAVLAAFVCLTITGNVDVYAQNPDPAKAAYTAVPDHASTEVHLPMLHKNASGWYSTVAVQNLSPTTQANVTVSLYSDSSTADDVKNLQIPAGAPALVRTFELAGLADGFSGSAVVSSDQPIAAAAMNTNGVSATAYGGFHEGSSSLYFTRMFYDGGSGLDFASTFAVQNTGASSATVNVTCTDGHNSNFVIGVNQSRIRNEETQGHADPFYSCGFTSDQPIVGVDENRDLAFPDFYTYRGLPGTSNSSVAPATYLANKSRSTSAFITSVGNAIADVIFTYEGSTSSDLMLDPLQTALAIDGSLASGYRGSLRVESTEPQLTFVEIRDSSTDGDQTASYVAPGTTDQGSTLHVPLAAKNARSVAAGGLTSSYINVSNVGTSSTNVTVTFTDANGNAQLPDSEAAGLQALAPFSLDAGESTEIDLSAIPSTDLPDGLYAAKIESDGEPLAAAVLLTVEFTAVFVDGFESGDTSTWSSTVQN